MRYVDLTLGSPEENLACDEAMLDWVEETDGEEILRFWESPGYFVALGLSNKAGTEVDQEACRERGIPILRRASGGGTVLQGPGCLNFALILKTDRPGTATITQTNALVLEAHRDALEPLLHQSIEVSGMTDLSIRNGAGNLKFSGNAQRRKRNTLLFHGTFLLEFEISLMENVLPLPARRPAYRQDRPHRDFLTNIRLEPGAVKAALQKSWNAFNSFNEVPYARIRRLVETKYSRPDWNQKH